MMMLNVYRLRGDRFHRQARGQREMALDLRQRADGNVSATLFLVLNLRQASF
ncbi:hypothetical protein [Martelella sp. AMO21009]